MTFTLLARDAETGALGGVAATGNLCVGGWVLRGDARAGLSASQGRSPSTLWGEDALALMAAGAHPSEAVARLVDGDRGRAKRQLALLSADGRTAGFDGAENHPFAGHLGGDGWIVSGNWLAGRAVIESTAQAYVGAKGPFAERLLAALRAGVDAGSDSRGTLSAALLVTALEVPPLSLRVDWDEQPVARLSALYERTREPSYRAWLDTLPTRSEPQAT